MDKSLAAKPLLSQVAELLNAVSGFAWPMLIIILLFLLRHQLKDIISAAIEKLQGSSEIEFGSLRLKGAIVTQSGDVLRNETAGLKIIEAAGIDIDQRNAEYRRSKMLMLVHTIKPAEPKEYIDEQRVFDASVFLHPHRSFGRLNDVKSVTYFFGDKRESGKHNPKYLVDNANDQFALTIQIYGSFLCIAEIEFQDGTKETLSRYIDVEMAPVYGVPLREAREGIH
jgi:hypothetical protein